MATIGRNKAVADLKVIRFGGRLAWLSWLFVHLLFLVGLRNQMLVFFQWAWAYFTYVKGFSADLWPVPACRPTTGIGRHRTREPRGSEMMAIDWSSWKPKELATLCFVRQGFRILMIRKETRSRSGEN